MMRLFEITILILVGCAHPEPVHKMAALAVDAAAKMSACAAQIPMGSTVHGMHVTFRDGGSLDLEPCARSHLLGSFNQSQDDWVVTVRNPYDAQPNMYNDASIDGGAWAPFYDAGYYPHIYQLNAHFTVPAVAPDHTVNNLWPGLQTDVGGGSPPKLGTIVLQPVLFSLGGTQWTIEFAICCDANKVIAPVFSLTANPGQVASFEVMINSDYPCPPSGLGCHYIEGFAVDSGVDHNHYGNNTMTFYVDPAEGPVDQIAFSTEPNAGTNCNSLAGGDNTCITWTIDDLYVVGDGVTSDPHAASGNLAMIKNYPGVFTAANSFTGTAATGFGYPLAGGAQITGGLPPWVYDTTTTLTPCQTTWGCSKCDASVSGNQVTLCH